MKTPPYFRSNLALAKILFGLTALAGLSVASPAKANLVTNPGFEDGFPLASPWTFSNGAADSPGSGAHSGSFFGNLPSNSVNLPSISQSLMTTAGQNYTISFFLASQVSAGILTNFAVSFDGTTFNSVLPTGNNAYAPFSFNAIAPTGATTLSFTVTSGVAAVRLDDVDVELAAPTGGVPETGNTILLMLAGIGPLVAFRQKIAATLRS